MTAQFKLGSVYRNHIGAFCRIVMVTEAGAVVETVDPMYPLSGKWSLETGKWTGRDQSLALVPGELHNVNGQWVPVTEEAPTPPEVAEAVQFLVGRMEARKAAANTTERVRPPLTWATPKPVDRFPGFTVKCDTGAQLAHDNHPLQRMSAESDPIHGSAFLRKG